MDTVTLNTARKIMKAIEGYKGPMTNDFFVPSIAETTLETPQTVTRVIEFLMEINKANNMAVATAPAPAAVPTAALVEIDDTPLNLMDELTYNYKVAKRCLETSMAKGHIIDADETRKSLRTIGSFMEQALKLQERLYNAQQMQKFQEAVLDTIASVDPQYRDAIIERMLNG